jgi:hypothetical protein
MKIKQIEEKILFRPKGVSQISETLKGYDGQEIAIADLPNHMSQDSEVLMSQINKTRADMQSFVQQNDFLPEEIKTLKESLRDLCSKSIIRSEESLFSINESDCDPHCLEIALKAEAIEILPDTKESGQVGLEKNVPPRIKDLGKVCFNTVKLAHTNTNGQKKSVAIKQCD